MLIRRLGLDGLPFLFELLSLALMQFLLALALLQVERFHLPFLLRCDAGVHAVHILLLLELKFLLPLLAFEQMTLDFRLRILAPSRPAGRQYPDKRQCA